MKNKPLAAVYAIFFLGIAISAWADGCLTAVPSFVYIYTPTGIGPPPNEDCLDPTCSYAIPKYQNCSEWACQPGFCGNPATSSYCTGQTANWTQQTNVEANQTVTCYHDVPGEIGEGCFNYTTEQAGTCVPGPSQQNSCYTAWYNKNSTRCNG